MKVQRTGSSLGRGFWPIGAAPGGRSAVATTRTSGMRSTTVNVKQNLLKAPWLIALTVLAASGPTTSAAPGDAGQPETGRMGTVTTRSGRGQGAASTPQDGVTSTSAHDVAGVFYDGTDRYKLGFDVRDAVGLPVDGAKVEVWVLAPLDPSAPLNDVSVGAAGDTAATGPGAPRNGQTALAASATEHGAINAFEARQVAIVPLAEGRTDAAGHLSLTLDAHRLETLDIDPTTVLPGPASDPGDGQALLLPRNVQYRVEGDLMPTAVMPEHGPPIDEGQVVVFVRNPAYAGPPLDQSEIASLEAAYDAQRAQMIESTLEPREIATTEDVAQILDALGDTDTADELRARFPSGVVDLSPGVPTVARTGEAGSLDRRGVMPDGLMGRIEPPTCVVDGVVSGGVKGVAFLDIDKNGEQNTSAEPSLAFTLVDLYARNGGSEWTVKETCMTGWSGRYEFDVHTNMELKVRFTPPHELLRATGPSYIVQPFRNQPWPGWVETLPFNKTYGWQVFERNVGFNGWVDTTVWVNGEVHPVDVHVGEVHLLPGMTGNAHVAHQKSLKLTADGSVGIPGPKITRSVPAGNQILPGSKLSEVILKSTFKIPLLTHEMTLSEALHEAGAMPFEDRAHDVWHRIPALAACSVRLRIVGPGILPVRVAHQWRCDLALDPARQTLVARPVPDGEATVPLVDGEMASFAPPDLRDETADHIMDYKRPIYDAYREPDVVNMRAGQVDSDKIPQYVIPTLNLGPFGLTFKVESVEANTYSIDRIIREAAWQHYNYIYEYGLDNQVVPGLVQFKMMENNPGFSSSDPAAQADHTVPFLAYLPKTNVICQNAYTETGAWDQYFIGPRIGISGPRLGVQLAGSVRIEHHDPECNGCASIVVTGGSNTFLRAYSEPVAGETGQYSWPWSHLAMQEEFVFDTPPDIGSSTIVDNDAFPPNVQLKVIRSGDSIWTPVASHLEQRANLAFNRVGPLALGVQSTDSEAGIERMGPVQVRYEAPSIADLLSYTHRLKGWARPNDQQGGFDQPDLLLENVIRPTDAFDSVWVDRPNAIHRRMPCLPRYADG